MVEQGVHALAGDVDALHELLALLPQRLDFGSERAKAQAHLRMNLQQTFDLVTNLLQFGECG